ncbi:Transcription factor GTE1 isoform B [Glycine soja]|uniref:Transcription factor GTE1 isoform B n=1 Tax=Glycine soja TaxID=3848 RepID=A0A445JKI6_GLYSO|nr:Transcription factor GTE1 isoform B [Glycine soja]
MDADPPQLDDHLEPFRVSVNQILTTVNKLEKQVTEVEQFYESTDNVQGNNSKGGSLAKEKGREKHITGTKKPLQDASHTEASSAKRMQELMRQFSTILRQITQHKWAWPFMDPVDVEGLGLHDYYEIIDKPMDFGTIKSKMEAKDGTGYNNVREIYADVRLIFKNAMKYNNEKNDVHVMAKTLLEKFEEKWLQLLPKVAEEEKRQLEEEAQAQLDIQLALETTYANKAKDISTELCEIDMHLKSLKEMVIQQCRALDIIAETNPMFQPSSTEDVVLDLDAQSDYTLWRLKAFVKDSLEEQVKVNAGAGINPNDNPDDKKNKKRRDSGDSSGKTNPKRKKLSTL